MEESIIFSILDLNQGENCNNHFFFLRTALDIIELGLNASLQHKYPMIKQSLERLSQRIQKETFQKDNKLLFMLENNMNAS